MEDFSSAEHIHFYQILERLVLLGRISNAEMETLLNKTGLTEISPGIYVDIRGASLKMK